MLVFVPLAGVLIVDATCKESVKENFIFFSKIVAGGGFRLKHLQRAAKYLKSESQAKA